MRKKSNFDCVVSLVTTIIVHSLDILTAVKRTVIPKPHNLGFCFIATASTHKELYGLMFAPQTIPASPAVLMCRSLKPRILVFGFDSRGGLPIALSSYPSSSDFSSPLLVQASFGVRLYVSIVWVGQ